MAKRCPSCGYAPIGPFTDNCPICAEPVRNVRGGGGGGFGWGRGGGGGIPPALKGVLIGLLIAVVAVVGCCGIGTWRMGQKFDDFQQEMLQAQAQAEAERQARTVVVSAADLLREFKEDPQAADDKYFGKYLELTGVVERAGRDRNDTPFLILHAGDGTVAVKIECFFELAGRADEARVRRLPKGQTVTVRGEYDGQVSHIQLRDCTLLPRPAGTGRTPAGDE